MSNQPLKKRNIVLIVIYLVAVVGLALVIYVWPNIIAEKAETYTAVYDVLEIGESSKALIVRNESIVTSDASGAVERSVSQGNLVRSRSKIVSVDGTGYYSKIRGIVSYKYDGLEAKFTPENMTELTYSAFDGIEESNPVKKIDAKSTTAGEPLFKTIDNQAWYFVTWMLPADAEKYSNNQSVKIALGDAEDTKLTAKVYSITKQEGVVQIIFSCNRLYEKFDELRVLDIRIIRMSQSGIILETDSIKTVGNIKGVYVVNKYGDANFMPISILASSGDKTVVTGNYFYEGDKTIPTVKNYDIVER